MYILLIGCISRDTNIMAPIHRAREKAFSLALCSDYTNPCFLIKIVV